MERQKLGSEFDRPREACGVFGVYDPAGNENIAQMIYQGLEALQHRGQEGAGIFVNTVHADGSIGLVGNKDTGLVSEAIPDGGITLGQIAPKSTVGVGHVRYGTSCCGEDFDAIQPLIGRDTAFALAHNGHIENFDDTLTDSQKLVRVVEKRGRELGSIDKALNDVLPRLNGAFCLAMTDGERLIAARDPWGFRPLCYGELPSGGFVVASETVALAQVGAKFVAEVEPGEIITFGGEGEQTSFKMNREVDRKICAFEYVYIARRDGTIQNMSVSRARKNMGEILAEQSPVEADVVIGVPDTGVDAAIGFSQKSGIPFELGIKKNPYSVRSFIQANQDLRRSMVMRKLQIDAATVAGKRVVAIDDSVVRGTSAKILVEMLRTAGAKEVHLRISSAPYKNSCYYGVDTGDEQTLLANNCTVEQMCAQLGADSLEFLSIEGLQRAIALPVGALCLACMDGRYPVRDNGSNARL